MELRHLRYFVAVASHGSFSRAAEILHLTQPPLSRQVKDLEEELGVALLVRSANTVKLTAAGELFYEEAREVLARADDAVRRVRAEAHQEILRVGYIPALTTGIISPALRKFREATPHVQIELLQLSTREINEQCKGGSLELAISVDAAVASSVSEFQWSELRRLKAMLYMPQSHPLAKLKRIPVERLRNLPLVGMAQDNYPEYVPMLRVLLKAFGITPRFVSLVNDDVSTVFAEMEARQAAAILAEGTLAVMPRSFVARPFSQMVRTVPVMIGLPVLRPNPHAQTFAQLLTKEAQAH